MCVMTLIQSTYTLRVESVAFAVDAYRRSKLILVCVLNVGTGKFANLCQCLHGLVWQVD